MKPNEKVNGEKYTEVMDSKLPTMTSIHHTAIFQQDEAPCHTAKVILKWFKENIIDLLEWPGNSPDLNPIENLWKLMKRKVASRRPKNLQDLQY